MNIIFCTLTILCIGQDLLIKDVNGKTVKFRGIVSAEKVVVKALKDVLNHINEGEFVV